MIKLKWINGKKVTDITEYVTSVTWSGTSTQAAREVTFSVANDPYDKNFWSSNSIKNSHEIKLYEGSTLIFYGRVMDIRRTSEIGTVDFTARDPLYNLLQSTTSGRWKKKTPEYITRSVCKQFKISVGTLTKTKYSIKKFIPKDKTPYDIIRIAYSKAKRNKTHKSYLIKMDGNKLCVVTKGKVLNNLVLRDDEVVYESSFEEDASGVVDKVRVIDSKRKLVNITKDKDLIKKYGVLQHVISVEKGKGKSEAKAEISTPERTATVSAIGNIRCVSGYKIQIKDSAAGLTGTYLIKNDSHTFENGIHLMTLDLALASVKKNTTTKVYSVASDEKTVWKKKTVNAVFFGYYATGRDARKKTRNYVKNTAAAASSIPLGAKVTVKGVDLPIITHRPDIKSTFTVSDRQQKAKFQNGLHYIGLLMPSAEEAKKFGEHKGKAEIRWKAKKSKKKGTKSSSTSSRAQKLVNIALFYRGKVRYVFNTANPDGGVSDCSGFVSHCLNKVGCNVGRIDTRALSQLGTGVDKRKRRAGDVVIFQGTWRAGPSHVGIMVDANSYVHCSSNGGVKVSSFNRAWVGQHFHSIRRVV